ncbi:MAG: GDYXXLXY domain-containing protein [Bacteroidota bacterium]
MNRTKTIIILLNLIIFLLYINWSIAQKEKTLETGVLALFELAPVDPRSLMQGDFMNLNYRMFRDTSVKQKRGYCVFFLDDNKVAQKLRLQTDTEPLADREYMVKYFMNGARMRFGAESYFFEEGTGKRYEDARYGGLRIDADGSSVLVGLYDEKYGLIH